MSVHSMERIDSALLDLRALGAEIANWDFGYPVEAATFEPGAAGSRIECLAALVSEPLPADYAYFLSRCAGFMGMDFNNGYVMHTPEEVARHFGLPGAPKRVTSSSSSIPVLPVGADGGGNVFLMQLRTPNLVLRWDHEIGGAWEAVSASHSSLRLIAEDFVSFLERIREDWSHFLGPDSTSWTYIA